MDVGIDRDGERKKRPKRDLEDIDEILDRINKITGFRDFFAPEEEKGEIVSWKPDAPEVLDTGDSLAVTLEVPGVQKDEIELFVGRDSISVEVREEGPRKYIKLPQDISPKNSKATYKNGILDIILKKV